MRLRFIPGILACTLINFSVLAETPTLSRHIDRVPSLDPAFSQSVDAARCVSLVYEPLLEYEYLTRPYRLRGCIAEDLPEISDNGLTLTFKIRRGIFFGPDRCFGDKVFRELTAEDVIFTFKRLADTKITSASYWVLENKIEGLDDFHAMTRAETPTDYNINVSGLSAPDPHTLIIKLSRPNPQILWMLAMPCTGIVPPEAIEYYGNQAFGEKEVGTGPFRLVHWRRNYRMTFDRRLTRDSERDETPLLSDATNSVPIHRINFLVIDDVSTRWLALMSGMLDIEGTIPKDNWDAVFDSDGKLSPEMSAKGLRMYTQPSPDAYYIGFNADDPVVGTNKKLRQALNCAFDFTAWESFSPGRMAQSTGPVPPGIAGRLESNFQYSFNLEKAKELLKEAGYPDGKDPNTGRRLVIQIGCGRTDQETRETMELISSFAEKIGVVLEAKYSNWPTFLQQISNRDLQAFRIGWISDYPDAENFLQLFHSKNVSPGPNRANYTNPEFDALYDRAMVTLNDETRFTIYKELQEILREDCPWIFLYHKRDIVLVNDRLRNFKMHDFPNGVEKHWRLFQNKSTGL